VSKEPQVFVGHEAGAHNTADSISRLKRAKSHSDLSTVMVVPTRGVIPARCVEAWMGLMAPMNQPFTRIFVSGMEVADAYNYALEMILNHELLSTWKYVLTVEEDNLPPPDGLLRLYESIGEYAAVGGLYWTKGPDGQPMQYGTEEGMLDFVPQIPQPNAVNPCNGLGMGFTLFRLELFRDEKIPRPWFKTLQTYTREAGGAAATQDLYFFGNARRAGHRVACDARVKVGHLDVASGYVW
jgi:hypothetical protein